MAAHIHAKNMALYAEDAIETEHPYNKWEVSLQGFIWETLNSNPRWNQVFKYRRKLKKILINGVEVVAAEVSAVPKGVNYYVPNVINSGLLSEYTWAGDVIDWRMLKDNLIYLNREDAIARTKAMLIYKEL